MFAKVVSKIATFAELLPTVFKLTPEVQFYSPGVGIFYLNRLMPVCRDALKLLRCDKLRVFIHRLACLALDILSSLRHVIREVV